MTEDNMIRYDSPEAAEFRTGLSGWVNRQGQFWGKDEHMARWSGCTHMICEHCGEVYQRGSWCGPCHRKKEQEKFLALEEIPYEKAEYPLCLYRDDRFFWDEDDLIDFIADNVSALNEGEELSLDVVTTQPGRLHLIDADQWSDDLPDEGELPCEVQKKLDELNEAIRAAAPVAHWPSNKRVNVDPLIAQVRKEPV